jgi:site-specific DNA-methyltransferase (adenine-specific)
MHFDLHHGDCLAVLRTLADNSVDSIVTDPPYGLSFMGKRWDYDVPSVEVWAECLRVLKPGGHLLAFAGTRTQHRMCVRIEDAGLEIRDMIAWVYGSGFPKSLDVSKAIDKAAGVEFDAVPASGVGFMNAEGAGGYNVTKNQLVRKGESTDAGRRWSGWGTALKPALEPITVARKPMGGRTVAENVLAHGTGAINVDGCRVEAPGEDCSRAPATVADTAAGFGKGLAMGGRGHDHGRWPANLIHDGSDEALAAFPGEADGSAARYFYCAKASKSDRGDGNGHPTVKPTDLMRYLCRLVTPPGGLVMDPFMGSGSTGKAAMLEGFRFVGIEREAEYLAIARARIEAAMPKQPNPEPSPANDNTTTALVQIDLFGT